MAVADSKKTAGPAARETAAAVAAATEGHPLKLVVCVFGIYLTFLTWGVLQERIATTPYGVDARIFRASHIINLVQNSLACFIGYLFLSWQRRSSREAKWQTSLVPTTQLLGSYLLVAACQSLSSPLAYASLRYVDYLTVLLAKSGKLLPVMAVHLLLYRRRFPQYKYVVVLMITAGVSLFSWKAQPVGVETKTELWGFVLLGINLFLDGLYNTTQDEMFSRFKNLTGPHMMCTLNFLTSVITLGMLLTSPQQRADTAWFVRHHPEVFRDIAVYGLCGAIGQVFIFITLAEFGSLVLVTTTVTRKMFSMLLSVFIFSHKMSALQWFGVGLVFSGVIAEALYKRSKK